MNHPADALPLPELSFDDCVSVLSQPTINDLQLFLNDYIRAAHREGYELAMRSLESKRINTDYEAFKRLTLVAVALCERHGLEVNGNVTEQLEALASQPAQEQSTKARKQPKPYFCPYCSRQDPEPTRDGTKCKHCRAVFSLEYIKRARISHAQPDCEEGRECEAPSVCKSAGHCMRG